MGCTDPLWTRGLFCQFTAGRVHICCLFNTLFQFLLPKKVAKVQVKLSISASGMIIAPIGPEMEGMDAGIINFHPMRVISLASGGEKEYYDFIS